MKVLDEELAADDKLLRRFIDAVTLTSYLDHPNILKGFDCSKIAEGYAIISEPLDGKPLSFFIQDGFPLEFEQAIRLIKDTAKVVRQAHLRGVIHGMLNPGCIFMTESEELTIDDFGLSWLARYARGELHGGTLLLHPYLSPEIRAREGVDGRSDIYSLGIMLLTLLSGEPELVTATSGPANLVKALPCLSHIDAVTLERLQVILQQCLHPNPNHRFGNMQELHRALDALQLPRPASSQQAPPAP